MVSSERTPTQEDQQSFHELHLFVNFTMSETRPQNARVVEPLKGPNGPSSKNLFYDLNRFVEGINQEPLELRIQSQNSRSQKTL